MLTYVYPEVKDNCNKTKMEDYIKVLRCILGCETLAQCVITQNMINNFRNKWHRECESGLLCIDLRAALHSRINSIQFNSAK